MGESLIMVATWTVAFLVVLLVLRLGNVFRYIPNNQVGIVGPIQQRSATGRFLALKKTSRGVR